MPGNRSILIVSLRWSTLATTPRAHVICLVFASVTSIISLPSLAVAIDSSNDIPHQNFIPSTLVLQDSHLVSLFLDLTAAIDDKINFLAGLRGLDGCAFGR